MNLYFNLVPSHLLFNTSIYHHLEFDLSLSYELPLTMLSNIRRALTPSASHIDDKDLPGMSIDNSSTAPNFHLHDSSPPPFSPLQVSEHHSPGYALHTTHGNGIVMDKQHDQPIDLSSNQSSMDPEREVTDDSLLGPVTADPHEDSHDGALSLDGAPGDHLQPQLKDTHSQSSLLPAPEPPQSTSKSQTHGSPTPSDINVESGPQSFNGPQPFNPVNKASPERTPRSHDVAYSKSMSARASAGPEESVPAAVEDAKMPSSPQNRQSKHSRDDSLSDLETKEAKKPRRQAREAEVFGATTEEQVAASDGMPKKRGKAKKEKGSLNTAKQQATTVDELPKKRGRAKKEEGSATTAKHRATTGDELPKKPGRPKKEDGSTSTVKPQAASRDELPKNRGRPTEDQGSAREAKSQRISKEDTPAKRGRPKKEAAPTADHTEKKNVKPTKGTAAPINQNKRGKKIPKQKEGAAEGDSAGIVQPANVPAPDATKKRGTPKKGAEAAQGIETQIVPTADTPRKRGTRGNNQDIANVDTAGSSKAEEIPKKRGRPKTIAQSETPKISTPAKRGRPSKKQATPKGAKPVGIVKKKAGRK